jgi:sortase B
MKWKKIVLTACLIASVCVCYHFRFQFLDAVRGIQRKYKEESEIPDEIDFAYWQGKNPDVCAWIRIPGTVTDYPILQSTDTEDGYYLTHDIDRESNIYGALYIEKLNNKRFSDSNTIVYGHNMRDGSMFGSLKKYNDQAYFQEHGTIQIYTPEEKRTYQIVAAYRYPAEHLPTFFDFSTAEGSSAYFAQIPEFVRNTGGNIRSDAEIKSPLLTLSTCTPGSKKMRYLVQAVLTGTEQTKTEESK